MNKTLLLLSLALSAFTLNSQITLTNADFATGGDTVRMSQANDLGIDYATTGPNSTWDFSSLTPTGQVLKDFRAMSGAPAFVQFLFGAFAPNKYQASYYIESTALPIAQITSFLPVSIENLFAFSKRSADSLTSVGYSMVVSGTDVPFKSDTIETRYDFPLQFGNSHFSRGYTMVDFNPILDAKWNQHRTRFTEIDGYGSITTPFGVFDALRIRHDITESDSIYYTFPIIGATWLPIPVPASHEYEWWTNGQKEPVLRISTTEIFGQETVNSIEYRDKYRNLSAGLNDLSVGMEIYPNPVQNELTINSEQVVESVSIFNNEGKLQMKNTVKSNQFKLDVSALSSGVYQVVLTSELGTSTKTFIKR
jgi:hypothetical protein